MNQWALITGGSMGIGRELASVFAANKFNLILVARNEARLQQAADELCAKYNIETKILVKDLSLPSAPQEIFDALRDTSISVLVNNAGFGWRGAFAECDLQHHALDMMHVNMDSLVALTRLFVPQMLARREGKILNLASTAAFQPGPFANIYFATKSFVLSFSTALSEELAGTGVSATALCPGTTRTEFFDRAGMKNLRRDSLMMDAGIVARAGYNGLMRGKPIVIPGVLNKLTAKLSNLVPTTVSNKIVRKINAA
ncbi:MAG TPA: SDR family oxidoreductase [Candidatus Angelobacter sp.]|nr:SDR family oxidoreductase [Candidatus Angelobacter sp.]